VFSPSPELGIDLLPEYHRTGIAMEVLPPFLARAKSLLKNEYFYSKIKKNNLPSQKLAEKIGGMCIGEKSLLPADFPKEMISFAEKEFPDFFYLEYHFMK
ncbi:MAG: GNAT family N-acetyltransferase, partial [Anaerotignum sp.]|nr:GNAT family N-acetyltransferase [Anaerotignum sp.]